MGTAIKAIQVEHTYFENLTLLAEEMTEIVGDKFPNPPRFLALKPKLKLKKL